ncbi:MAG: hypothetical protein ACRC5W_03965 [Cetobacterium sp.]|uniref:hypothetical protein n=1 Tax=Cetobacterium sp. TaxID=2071632 RepID=UPI003F2B4035
MGILQNFRVLKEKELFNFIASELYYTDLISEDLLPENAELTPEELVNIYLNSVNAVYDILPIETYEFLKIYFENNKKIPATHELTSCLDTLKNYGLVCFDENDIKEMDLMLDLKYNRIHSYPDDLMKEKEFHNILLDEDYARLLLQFLELNKELISEEIKARDIILEILSAHLTIPLQKLEKVLEEHGFKIHDLYSFLENKLIHGSMVFYSTNGTDILVAHPSLDIELEMLKK